MLRAHRGKAQYIHCVIPRLSRCTVRYGLFPSRPAKKYNNDVTLQTSVGSSKKSINSDKVGLRIACIVENTLPHILRKCVSRLVYSNRRNNSHPIFFGGSAISVRNLPPNLRATRNWRAFMRREPYRAELRSYAKRAAVPRENEDRVKPYPLAIVLLQTAKVRECGQTNGRTRWARRQVDGLRVFEMPRGNPGDVRRVARQLGLFAGAFGALCRTLFFIVRGCQLGVAFSALHFLGGEINKKGTSPRGQCWSKFGQHWSTLARFRSTLVEAPADASKCDLS